MWERTQSIILLGLFQYLSAAINTGNADLGEKKRKGKKRNGYSGLFERENRQLNWHLSACESEDLLGALVERKNGTTV